MADKKLFLKSVKRPLFKKIILSERVYFIDDNDLLLTDIKKAAYTLNYFLRMLLSTFK